MSPSRPSSNVYVLPSPVIAAPGTRPRRSRSIRLRGLTWWWRLRLTAREVTDALRRFGRPQSRKEAGSFDLEVDAFEVRAPRRPAGPAQVIDIAAAARRRSSAR
jgi:hypothetical protein